MSKWVSYSFILLEHGQGLRHEVSTGRREGIQTPKNCQPPNHSFSSEFGHLMLKCLKI